MTHLRIRRAMPADRDALVAFNADVLRYQDSPELDDSVEKAQVPGSPWMVGVLGGNVSATLAELAIARGGHVRVGLEDYAGPKQPNNAGLVADVVGMAQRLRRPIATAAQAAEILQLPR